MQQSSRTTPVNGRGIDGWLRLAAFGPASFLPFDFFSEGANDTLSSRIASSPSKPYFDAHARINSALNADIAFDTVALIVTLDISIILFSLFDFHFTYTLFYISIFFFITYSHHLLKKIPPLKKVEPNPTAKLKFENSNG
jgi:hypothetical protein